MGREIMQDGGVEIKMDAAATRLAFDQAVPESRYLDLGYGFVLSCSRAVSLSSVFTRARYADKLSAKPISSHAWMTTE